MPDVPLDDVELLSASIQVPNHVAIREFADESVALNLRSGSYHGLNTVAARMLERLREVEIPRDAVDSLAEEFGEQRAVIEHDLANLLRGLIERGLVEVRDPEES
jgi:hypothetical protein